MRSSAVRSSATISAAAISSATVSAAANPDADAEPVEDDRRLKDRGRVIIDRRRIDWRLTRVALSVGRLIVPAGADRGHLRVGGHAECPRPEGHGDQAWQRDHSHGIISRSGRLIDASEDSRRSSCRDRFGNYLCPRFVRKPRTGVCHRVGTDRRAAGYDSREADR
jgi:hypothetical protein